jgi:hypothetical protein
MWDVVTTEAFSTWFDALDGEAKVDVFAKIELLREYGPALKRPHADTLNGSKFANMKELRAGTAEEVLRIAFAFDPVRRAILLIGGDKRGVGQKRFYKELIRKADALFAEHVNQLGQQN